MEKDNQLELRHKLGDRLWCSIEGNDLDLAKQCIKLKADVNYIRKHRHGESALHIAATHNNVDAIKLLLLNGANVNAKDYDNWSALHKAARNNNVEASKHLFMQCCMVKRGLSIVVFGVYVCTIQ